MSQSLVERRGRFTHAVHTMGAQIARPFFSVAYASSDAQGNLATANMYVKFGQSIFTHWEAIKNREL
jgi:hypothetical protein